MVRVIEVYRGSNGFQKGSSLHCEDGVVEVVRVCGGSPLSGLLKAERATGHHKNDKKRH